MLVPGLKSKDNFERMFEPNELDTLGDRWGHRWRGSQKLRYGIYLKILRKALGNPNGYKVLDIGCGQSDFLLRLREMYPRFDYYGTDISENVIAWNCRMHPFISYKQSALPEVGYPPDTFDVICALEVLYYMEEPQQKVALHNIAKSLKPGGLLLISGPLDGGKQYFEENAILKAVGDVLSIKRVEYNYGRLYTYLEKHLLKTFWLLRKAGKLLTLPDVEFEQWIVGRNGWRTLVVILARRRVIRQVIRLAINTLVWLLKRVLGWVWLPRLCFVLTKILMPATGKTGIIILARKCDK
ncbi:MAG: class I SAM-dependent methyltransferase [Candidatus Hadarchaeum sp.]